MLHTDTYSAAFITGRTFAASLIPERKAAVSGSVAIVTLLASCRSHCAVSWGRGGRVNDPGYMSRKNQKF